MVIKLERQDALLIARIVELWKPTTNIYDQWKKDIVEHLRNAANGQTVPQVFPNT